MCIKYVYIVYLTYNRYNTCQIRKSLYGDIDLNISYILIIYSVFYI